ncbi:uncharacterized protein [Venturia canescens]|uniref:uncharacterized protein n=1 Tax=Venturia canescens TaxID=32260 RepID=UPI001C9C9EBA|nr:uncharacterized protein LOC122411982 [Venturia canescens]
MEKLIFFSVVASVFLATAVQASLHENASAIANLASGDCKCENYNCGCCQHIQWIETGIDANLCTNFSYLPQDYGVSMTITWNNYTILNETFSATNPPPLCFGIPELEKVSALICLRLYELKFSSEHFHGCARLTMSVYHILKKRIELGCFNIPNSSLRETEAQKLHNAFLFVKEYLHELEFLNNTGPTVNMI